MSLWRQFLRKLGLLRPDRLSFEADEVLLRSLQQFAEQEQRPREAVASDLLQQAVQQRQLAESSLERWNSLSAREQQVAALICLGYTNRQIAYRLGVAVETVRSHTRNLLLKFGFTTKVQLRVALSDWDFSQWDDGTLPEDDSLFD